jgi:DNA polymerase III subunit gamma/tau
VKNTLAFVVISDLDVMPEIRDMAKVINCVNYKSQGGITACGKCPSCISFKSNTSFNIHEMDAASDGQLQDIKNIAQQSIYPPQQGVVFNAQELSIESSQILVKTIKRMDKFNVFHLLMKKEPKPNVAKDLQLSCIVSTIREDNLYDFS